MEKRKSKHGRIGEFGWISLSSRMRRSMKDKGWGRVWRIKDEEEYGGKRMKIRKDGWACHLGWGAVWKIKDEEENEG